MSALSATLQRTTPPPVASHASFRVQLERELARELGPETPLAEVARPLVTSSEAKRARAQVAALFAQVFGATERLALDVAVAVELVHAASLLHDDVLDGAITRRGLPTANQLHGPVLAVLAGDLVLTAALRRLVRLGSSAIERAIDVVAEMSHAVAFELSARRRADLRLDEWRHMAEGKTGALFGAVPRLIGEGLGRREEAERFDRALRHLGVAFQVADDVSDFAQEGGETPFQDLVEGNPSVVIALAAQRDPTIARTLEALWSKGMADNGLSATSPSVQALVAAIFATGAIAEARRLAADEVTRARALLEPELLDDSSRRSFAVARLLEWADALVGVAERRVSRETAVDETGSAPGMVGTSATSAARPGPAASPQGSGRSERGR